jgi:hypothetical protein
VYLCASHAAPRECPALDYCVHTLDGAAALLNSSHAFPSRASVPPESVGNFSSLARRLYRVLSHAWGHHRGDVFEPFERDTATAARLSALARRYGLLSPEQLVIPDADLPALAAPQQSGDGGGGGDGGRSEQPPPAVASDATDEQGT